MALSEKGMFTTRQAAILAGSGLLAMAAAAAFSYGYAHGTLLVPGDATATVHNVITNTGLFKAEILGWLIILLCDIVVAWACYVFFQPVHKHLSMLAASFRLIYTTILGMAIIQLVSALLLSNNQTLFSGNSSSLATQIMLHFQTFETVWSMGLIVFGFHLLLLGVLALRAERIPRIIGILLLVAGVGYLIVHTDDLLLIGSPDIMTMVENILILPMTAGELGLALWLLFRGGKTRHLSSTSVPSTQLAQ